MSHLAQSPPVRRAHLNRIGCATPPHDIHQGFVELGAGMLADERTRALFGKMAKRAGIAHRYSTLGIASPGSAAVDSEGFYRRGHFPSTAARMRRYDAAALPLALAAVEQLDIGDTAGITHLIVVSCTGFAAPGLDLQLIAALGLSKTVFRTLIGFMGCSAAIPALRSAADIVAAHPRARVLIVNLELCTLHFQETADLETVLTFLLFADGCSAALVTAERAGFALDSFHTEVVPDSGELITWEIGDTGFDMHLAGAVPATIGRALQAALQANAPDGMLRGEVPEAIRHWAVHAGGKTVLDAVERSLNLAPEALAVSRSVLHDCGNMSSATIMFTLQRILRGARPGERGLALGFGPGMVTESLHFTAA